MHKLSPCPLCVVFNRKKQKTKRKIQKKDFIYALHFFVSLTFCTYLKRLTSVSGLTEPYSRSAKILYNMYMYFYSYAYKYMSVICLLCPVFFIFSPTPEPQKLHFEMHAWTAQRCLERESENNFFSRHKHEFLFIISQSKPTNILCLLLLAHSFDSLSFPLL